MEDETFHQHLVQWDLLSGDLGEQEYFMSVYPARLDMKFQVLSMLYLEGNPQQRRDLIKFFATATAVARPPSAHARFDNVIVYMRRVARCIRCAPDRFLLRLGLAAAALTSSRVDSHDLLVSLAFLYYSASRAGIDPAPDFDNIAATACPQIQEVLRAFLHSDIATISRMVHHYEGTC